jgi:hypothetical protein
VAGPVDTREVEVGTGRAGGGQAELARAVVATGGGR